MFDFVCNMFKQMLVLLVLTGGTLLLVKGVIRLAISFVPKFLRKPIKNFCYNKVNELYKFYTANSSKSNKHSTKESNKKVS